MIDRKLRTAEEMKYVIEASSLLEHKRTKRQISYDVIDAGGVGLATFYLTLPKKMTYEQALHLCDKPFHISFNSDETLCLSLSSYGGNIDNIEWAIGKLRTALTKFHKKDFVILDKS